MLLGISDLKFQISDLKFAIPKGHQRLNLIWNTSFATDTAEIRMIR
jgi:hypothetical protein